MKLDFEYDEFDGEQSLNDYNYEDAEDHELLSKKRRIQKLIEERLKKKKLREEFKDVFDEEDDFEDEFDWDR